jgi:hypothetical protein
MSSPSSCYAESVFSHLEKVQKLPLEVQTDIAKRVDTYLSVARTANNEAIVATVASSAMQEQAKAIGQGGTMDPRWAAPAIVEAWCYATMAGRGAAGRGAAGVGRLKAKLMRGATAT